MSAANEPWFKAIEEKPRDGKRRIHLVRRGADEPGLWGDRGCEYVLSLEQANALYSSLGALLVERGPATTDWQPIATAPKSGEVLVVVLRAGCRGRVVAHYMPGGHCIEDHPSIPAGWYRWSGFSMQLLEDAPTHWMPLPDLPCGDPAAKAGGR